ncbi:MAG TPA: hypothetical protein VJ694_01645 [Patescibacteria group bacterium]|nr:hypothetical protein [Patescibacteria group bacterium]
MDRIEAILDAACESQRDALRTYHETGSEADAARVHFESCPDCERALEAVAAARGAAPKIPPPPAGFTFSDLAPLLFLGAFLIGIFGLFGYVLIRPFFADDGAKSEIGRLESRVQYVRMPGRPDVCVAAIQGERAYGPTFLGSAPCDLVEERYTGDERILSTLRSFVVTRIRGTDECLAHEPGGDGNFTFRCGPGPD